MNKINFVGIYSMKYAKVNFLITLCNYFINIAIQKTLNKCPEIHR